MELQMNDGGVLQVGVGRARDPEPESGETIYELRFKWLGDGRGPVKINGKSRPAVSLGLVGQGPLAAILAAANDFLDGSE